MSSVYDAKWNNVANKIRQLKANNHDRLPLDQTIDLLDDCFSRVTSVPSTQQLDDVARELKDSPLIIHFQKKLEEKAQKFKIGMLPNVFSKYLKSDTFNNIIESIKYSMSVGDDEVFKLIKVLQNPAIDAIQKHHRMEQILMNHVASTEQLAKILEITKETNPYLTVVLGQTLDQIPAHKINGQTAKAFLQSREWKQASSALLDLKSGGHAGKAWHLMEQARLMNDPIYGDVFIENPQFIKKLESARLNYRISKQDNLIKQFVAGFDDHGKYWRGWRDAAESLPQTLRKWFLPG